MKTICISFLILLMAVSAHATDVSLQWDANTETDLAGYRVYEGATTNPAEFQRVQEVTGTSTSITKLDSTKSHSFAVTAINTAGIESAFSNIVTIPAAPAIPANLKWTITLTVTGAR